MTARILEVDTAAAIVVFNLCRLGPGGIGPIIETALPDAFEDMVELSLAYQECVVLGPDLAILIRKVTSKRCSGVASGTFAAWRRQ